MQVTSQKNILTYMSFNQDSSCIALGTTKGIRTYSTTPFKSLYTRNFPEGINIVSMLYRSSILALTGTGGNPRYPREAVVIYDDQTGRTIVEIKFSSLILNVRMSRDKVFIVTAKKVFVYNLTDLHLVEQFETSNNPYGLIAIYGEKENETILATLGSIPGQIQVRRYIKEVNDPNSVSSPINNNGQTANPSTSNGYQVITATHMCHENGIRALTISPDGRFFATASTKGTLLRIFSLENNLAQVYEVRRGTEKADIQSIAFAPNSSLICVTSNHQTLHVFSLFSIAGADGSVAIENKKSKFVWLKKTNEYFASEWSFAKFPLSDPVSIATFMKNDTIGVICGDGMFYKLVVSPNKVIEKELAVNLLNQDK